MSNIRFSAVAFVLILASGCGKPYSVKEVDESAPVRSAQSSAASDGKLSAQSAQYLRQHCLQELPPKSTRDTLERLLAQFKNQSSRPAAFVLSELYYLEGSKHPAASDEAARCFLTSAMFAYAFLFDTQLAGVCSPFDRRYPIACDTYNRALSRVLTGHPLTGKDDSESMQMSSLVGQVRIVEQTWKLPWPRSRFDRFESAYRYEVKGIDDPCRQEGLGVPLIAFWTRNASDPPADTDAFLQRLPTQGFAATLCMRFRGSIVDAVRNPNGEIAADISVLDPVVDSTIEVAGRAIPIEADIATPLAFSIDHAPPLSGFKGFMDTTSWGDRRGLFMAHPYQKGKIPVVFVYGLTGKPTTWVPMFNHLISNEVLRSKFQFWYFMYPTGNPVLYSAEVLRADLLKAKRVFDPDGSDAAFDQMVIVGHSMGGLVTRLQVTESGDRMWSTVVKQPFDSSHLSDANGKLIHSVFFFEPLPFVKRVVFMATPHRGSALADSRIAGLFSSEVRLEDQIQLAVAEYLKTVSPNTRSADHIPTAVDSLSAKNPVLVALDQIPVAKGVRYHSIVANRDAAGVAGGTDSIVPYTSSHLDGAFSEHIIHSKHSCTRNPFAIREVERILLLHMAELDGGAKQSPELSLSN